MILLFLGDVISSPGFTNESRSPRSRSPRCNDKILAQDLTGCHDSMPPIVPFPVSQEIDVQPDAVKIPTAVESKFNTTCELSSNQCVETNSDEAQLSPSKIRRGEQHVQNDQDPIAGPSTPSPVLPYPDGVTHADVVNPNRPPNGSPKSSPKPNARPKKAAFASRASKASRRK